MPGWKDLEESLKPLSTEERIKRAYQEGVGRGVAAGTVFGLLLAWLFRWLAS